ncbi:MAG TPA: glycosyltransferase family 1 protein [Myxococcota bacterium]|nr:glycosyltransferase family 1 protein [Myxococcota bacterium]
MTGLAYHSGGITGIQRVQLGVAEQLLRDRRWCDVTFCYFEGRVGYRAIRRAAVAEIVKTIGSAAVSWHARNRSKIAAVRRLERSLAKRVGRGAPFARGDVLLNLGFSTYRERYRDLAGEILAARGVRYVGMIYDLLMVTHPEWWEPEIIDLHRAWFSFTGRISDPILCCSAATQRDFEWFLASAQLPPRRIHTIRLADGLSLFAPSPSHEVRPPPRSPYVLYVSQFDVRKNHRLLVDVWQRLVAEYGAERVPELLCVGRAGFGGAALVRELEAAADGLIRVRQEVSDQELARLYRDCLFTVYPSFAEGWGLPIGESLGHGKYCVASSTSSLPEVGGVLVDYHDPTDVARAADLIARAAFDADFRAAREAEIRRKYRIRTWQDALAEIVRAVWEPTPPEEPGQPGRTLPTGPGSPDPPADGPRLD